MKRFLLLSPLAALLSVTAAFAGIDKGNGELGFDVGYTQFDRDIVDEGGARLAIRGGYHVTRLFEIEGQAAASAHYSTDAILHHGNRRAEISLATFLLDGVFNFRSPGGNIVPYVLAGAGTGTLDFQVADAKDSGFAYVIAGGSRFFFGDRHRTALRLEVSRISIRAFDLTTHHVSGTFGFTWRLGHSS